MRAFVRTAAMAAALAVMFGLGQSATAQGKKPAAATDSVTVKYSGKGKVDATHQLWVWLFEDPNIGPGSMPIAEEAIDENGGTATFTNVPLKQVYVAVAYDEAGGFGGNAPPPPGSPIAIYGAKGPDDKAQPVTPGAKTSVTVTFDEKQRMK
jgi:hypothetical protein